MAPKPTKHKEPTPGRQHPCKKCGNIHKERRPNDENDECNESADESPNGTLGEPRISKNQYKRYKNRIKKLKINVVFNYSSIVLTESMDRVLNRGLKFAIMPLKLDITQVLTDFRRFERAMVWKEFWYGKDSEEPYVPPIFKQKKTNFPRKHKSPKGSSEVRTSRYQIPTEGSQ